MAFGALFSGLSKIFPAEENPISTQEEHDQLEQKIWRYITDKDSNPERFKENFKLNDVISNKIWDRYSEFKCDLTCI